MRSPAGDALVGDKPMGGGVFEDDRKQSGGIFLVKKIINRWVYRPFAWVKNLEQTL